MVDEIVRAEKKKRELEISELKDVIKFKSHKLNHYVLNLRNMIQERKAIKEKND